MFEVFYRTLPVLLTLVQWQHVVGKPSPKGAEGILAGNSPAYCFGAVPAPYSDTYASVGKMCLANMFQQPNGGCQCNESNMLVCYEGGDLARKCEQLCECLPEEPEVIHNTTGKLHT